MKVLLANTTCKVGGVSTFMLALRSALVGLGHECELFFFSGGSMTPHLPPGVPAHFGDLAACLQLVARGGFDVVHANNVDWPTGIAAVRNVGARLVVTAHKSREAAWTYGWTTANCDALTTVSDWVRRDLQPFTDVPIQTVHNGVDVLRYSPDHRAETTPPIVAWIGRGGSPLKGLPGFAALAPALHRAGLRLWLLDQHGPDAAARVFPDAARALRPLVERWRGAPFDEMPELYRQIAASGGCVVSTSTREGLPLTLLEAQACGCVVAASDVEGNNECVSPAHGGILFPLSMPADAKSSVIVALVSDRPRQRERQRAAAAYVRDQFSLDRMARRYLDVYRALPLRVAGRLPERLRARMRLSPLIHWNQYLAQRLGAGHEQFESSRALARLGEWRLAAGAGRASVRTSPTILLNPQRVAHLLTVWMRRYGRDAIREPGERSEPC